MNKKFVAGKNEYAFDMSTSSGLKKLLEILRHVYGIDISVSDICQGSAQHSHAKNERYRRYYLYGKFSSAIKIVSRIKGHTDVSIVQRYVINDETLSRLNGKMLRGYLIDGL